MVNNKLPARKGNKRRTRKAVMLACFVKDIIAFGYKKSSRINLPMHRIFFSIVVNEKRMKREISMTGKQTRKPAMHFQK